MNEYKDLGNGVTQLIITGTKNPGTVLVSTIDVPRLKGHSWYIKDTSGTTKQHSYVAAKINNKTVKIHRFILEVEDRSILVDHRDRNSLNNTRDNLRRATSSENNRNCSMSSNNVSGRTGVYLKKGRGNNRSDCWVAQYQANGKKATKGFSTKMYGEEQAYEMAVAFRESWEQEHGIMTERTFNDYRKHAT